MITGPYPGFPTDLQPQLMSLLIMCHGESSIKEMVFENRMSHGSIYAHLFLLCHMHFMYAKYPGLTLPTSMNVSCLCSQGASKAWRKNMSIEE